MVNRESGIGAAKAAALAVQNRLIADKNDIDIEFLSGLQGAFNGGSRPMVSPHRVEGNFHAGWRVHKESCRQWQCVDDMRGLLSWAGSLQ
jgi:hypothetical protein